MKIFYSIKKNNECRKIIISQFYFFNYTIFFVFILFHEVFVMCKYNNEIGHISKSYTHFAVYSKITCRIFPVVTITIDFIKYYDIHQNCENNKLSVKKFSILEFDKNVLINLNKIVTNKSMIYELKNSCVNIIYRYIISVVNISFRYII